MADYFASIFGTEKDKVNCSFYFKIGACRHGDRCSRVHNKPSFSQTVLLQNLYENPRNSTKSDGRFITDEEDQQHFDEFFEDIFVEVEEKYGSIEELNVCDNLGDHLIGNVYVKFKSEEDAERAVEQLNDRWFGGKPVYAELSTVTDFREAGCRQYEMGACTRGGFCNFMHLKQISDRLRRHLFGSSKNSTRRSDRHSQRLHLSRSRSRSRSSSLTRHKSSHGRRRRSHKSSRKSSSSRRHRSPQSSRSHSRSPLTPPPGTRSPRSRSRSPLGERSSRSRSPSSIRRASRSRSGTPSPPHHSSKSSRSHKRSQHKSSPTTRRD